MLNAYDHDTDRVTDRAVLTPERSHRERKRDLVLDPVLNPDEEEVERGGPDQS